jgi:two-component system chemotaxis response regulator CheY
MNIPTSASFSGVPPIVLFVEPDRDTLDMYATFFEMSGVWVAKSTTGEDALAGLADLRPDLVVADAGVAGHVDVSEFVHTLKSREDTQQIPVIMLGGYPGTLGSPEAQRSEADLWLLKPVLPDDLLGRVRELIQASVVLRQRSGAVLKKTAEPHERSRRLIARSHEMASRFQAAACEPAVRACPGCGHDLEWIERGRIGGVEYDYFRWCTRGCGLHCYDLTSEKWVKLV